MKRILTIFLLLIISINGVNAKELENYNITEGLDLNKEIELTSKNIVLYSLNDKKTLYEYNSEEKVQVASLTKIMTTLVALENIDNLDEKITINYDTFKGIEEYSKAGFNIGQEVSYKELLYGVMLPSGADAVNAIILNLGTTEEFIEKMNQKAKELKMNNTHFDNAIGMDSEDNYSTAKDLSILLENALNNKTFYEIFTTKEYKIERLSLKLESTLLKYSRNTTIDISKILGAKSGFTDNAGLCLASIAKINDVEYMLINLNANYKINRSNAVKDAVKIYNFFDENFSYKEVLKKGQILHEINNKFGYEKQYSIKSQDNIKYLLSNDIDTKDIKYLYEGLEEINYKNKVGDKLGKVYITIDDKKIYEYDVYLNDKLKYHHPVLVVIIVLSVAFIIFLLNKVRKNKKRNRRRRKHRRK